VIRASIIVISHFGHGGRERGNMVLRLAQAGALPSSQSPGRYRYRAGDVRSLQPFAGAPLVNFAHF
jgi:hypothetical protein